MEEEKVMEKIVDVNDIHKITSIIKWLDKNTVMRINVNLFKYDSKGNRNPYFRALMYNHPKHEDLNVNVNLELDTFVSIENIKAVNGIKSYIRLSQYDIYWLYTSLYNMYVTLDSEFDQYFKKIDDSYVIAKRGTPIEIETRFGGPIIMEPCIVPLNNSYTGGIRLCLGEVTNYVMLTLPQALELYLILKGINIPMYGQLLVNYQGMPELNSDNVYNMADKFDSKPKYNDIFHK